MSSPYPCPCEINQREEKIAKEMNSEEVKCLVLKKTKQNYNEYNKLKNFVPETNAITVLNI